MKKWLAILLVVFLISNSPNNVVAAQPITVIINDQQIQFDVQPVVEKDRVLVPLRAIFEVLGATVNYDGTTETIIATKGQTRIRLQTFATHGFRDEEAIPLDVPAKVIQGRTMVPLRFISESLGAGVEWDTNSRMVKIEPDAERQKIQYENEDHPVWENKQSVIVDEQTKASRHAGDIPLVTLAEKDIGQITQRWQQDNYFNYHEIIDLNNSFISPTLSETLGFIKWGDTAMERFERLLSYFSADVKDSSGWKEFISLEAKRDPVFSVLWATSTRDHISATLFGDLSPGFEVVPAIMDVEIKKQPDSEQWLFTKIDKVRAYETLEELKQQDSLTYEMIVQMENYRYNNGSNKYYN